LISQGEAEGIIAGSMLVFTAMFFSTLALGPERLRMPGWKIEPAAQRKTSPPAAAGSTASNGSS
jgi:hypothetical protein